MSKLISKVNLDDVKKYLEKIKEDELEAGIKDANYVHYQLSPASTWNVVHNLNKKPSIEIIDSASSKIEGDIVYIDDNNVQINFTSAFGGTATCN
ncbi:MAG: hypothetical protein ABFD61_02695 [Chloroherpetonaceae bacterium]